MRGIRRGDLALYVTDSGVYDEHGRLATAAAAKTPDMAKLADIALDNMEHTAFQCRQEDEKSIYTFTVNPTGMKQILLAVFPQAQELNLGYGVGSLEAVIDQGKLSQLRLGCGGSGALAGLSVDIQLNLEANLYEPVPVPVLPEAVQKVIASESHVIDQGKLSQLRLGCGGSGALAGLSVDIQLNLEANLYEPVPVPVLPEAVQKVIASESQKQ